MTSVPSPEESPGGRRSIGGEFPLQDSSDAAPSSTLLHQLEQPAAGDLHLFASGRGALRALLRALAAEGRDTLVLPGYICDSVLRATKYAGTDWRLRGSTRRRPSNLTRTSSWRSIGALARGSGSRGAAVRIRLLGRTARGGARRPRPWEHGGMGPDARALLRLGSAMRGASRRQPSQVVWTSGRRTPPWRKSTDRPRHGSSVGPRDRARSPVRSTSALRAR
jgi:hypothetical protein